MAEQDGPHLPSSGEMFVPPQRDMPTMSPPTEPAAPPVMSYQVDLSQTDVLCRRCQFNLRGLTPERNCPECGFSIERTLAGDPLIFSSRNYLSTLASGLKWIIVATIVQFCMSFLGGIIGAVVGATTQGNANQIQIIHNVQLIAVLITIPVSLALLFGWWKFSTPDPEIIVGDTGDAPRRIVRGATALLLITTILSTVATYYNTNPMAINPFVIGIGLLASAAMIAQFFASLMYARWIALRMQDAKLASTASMYLWLLPVIYIVGFCVFFIGPIVATIMYLLMLNRVRKGINFILADQALQNAKIEPA